MTNEKILTQWVIENISKRKTKNTSRTSYGLKHSAEKALGFYISAAMDETLHLRHTLQHIYAKTLLALEPQGVPDHEDNQCQ